MKPKNLSQAISWYLMSCYLYYGTEHNLEPVLTDSEYDELCEYIASQAKNLKKCKHPHAHLATKENLKVSGFKVKVPTIAKKAAFNWNREDDK